MQPFVYADALGFVNDPGRNPFANPGLPNQLRVMHTTVAKPTPSSTAQCIRQIGTFLRTAKKQSHLRTVETFQDINLDQSHTALVMGLQNPPTDVVEGFNLHYLRVWGIRIIGLAYQGANAFGTGFDIPNGQLTTEGERFLSACADAG